MIIDTHSVNSVVLKVGKCMHINYEKRASDVQHKKYGLNKWNKNQMLHYIII